MRRSWAYEGVRKMIHTIPRLNFPVETLRAENRDRPPGLGPNVSKSTFVAGVLNALALRVGHWQKLG